MDFSVDVHYNSSKDEELKKLSEKTRIFAIPKKSAFVCENSGLSFKGEVYLFFKENKTKC